MSGRSPDPAEPGAVLAALKTKPPAAVARPLGGPVFDRGCARRPLGARSGRRNGAQSNKETGFEGRREA